MTVPVIMQQQAVLRPPPPKPFYDARPKLADARQIERQVGGWQCSATSVANGLQCIGMAIHQTDVINLMNSGSVPPATNDPPEADAYDPHPRITVANGLEAGNAYGLVRVLNHPNGFGFAGRASRGKLGWDEIKAIAGTRPVMMGSHTWDHWTCVLAVSPTGALRLANPAPGWQGVGDEMDLDQFERFSPFWVVWIDP